MTHTLSGVSGTAVTRLEDAGPQISVREYHECLKTIVLILMRSAGPPFGTVELLFQRQTLREVRVITSVIIAKDPGHTQLAHSFYDACAEMTNRAAFRCRFRF